MWARWPLTDRAWLDTASVEPFRSPFKSWSYLLPTATRQVKGGIAIILTPGSNDSHHRYGKWVLKGFPQLHPAHQWEHVGWILSLGQGHPTPRLNSKVSTKVSPSKYILLFCPRSYQSLTVDKSCVVGWGRETGESKAKGRPSGCPESALKLHFPPRSLDLSSPPSPVISQFCPQIQIQINTAPCVSRKEAYVWFMRSKKKTALLLSWLNSEVFSLADYPEPTTCRCD